MSQAKSCWNSDVVCLWPFISVQDWKTFKKYWATIMFPASTSNQCGLFHIRCTLWVTRQCYEEWGGNCEICLQMFNNHLNILKIYLYMCLYTFLHYSWFRNLKMLKTSTGISYHGEKKSRCAQVKAKSAVESEAQTHTLVQITLLSTS